LVVNIEVSLLLDKGFNEVSHMFEIDVDDWG